MFDPFLSIMLINILFFLGLLLMFIFVVRGQDRITARIHDVEERCLLAIGELETTLLDIQAGLKSEIAPPPQPAGMEDLGTLLATIPTNSDLKNQFLTLEKNDNRSNGAKNPLDIKFG